MTDKPLLEAYVDAYFSTFKNINELISEPMAQYHLSFEQYRILSDIANDPTISLTAIVAKRGVTKPAVARQIRVLRNLNYVTQSKFEADRRRNTLQLTPLGKRVEAAITKEASERFNEWVNALGVRKAKQFVKLLNEIGAKVIQPQQAAKKEQ
ncbi:MarR family winged helix-turn-helix transcriptional regulator [Lacticaseibacillus parahuelsenbergensis]|uniref:MarR family winged helix-turn-helix transcriptional regulator n=1 Tax=Lacticaseibacillus parahuelsenbergensis TaxID=3068305 RepID=A0ABY9L894_9LACO|nr:MULTISPECIES: MarR family winged helix-turn-helix transcriptional regulator [Lacticaseibacillus]MDE3281777.1 MarR family winged helix-turn-helix transcriptional regulator [Lacticaseibacillus casei]WLV78710.1 MarR family winged helix-turn-helix transcriptional regulator [Lacticaseibacillus sp. NCIMB 15471]